MQLHISTCPPLEVHEIVNFLEVWITTQKHIHGQNFPHLLAPEATSYLTRTSHRPIFLNRFNERPISNIHFSTF